jgi:pyrimidine operon attenuation protein / uracil phosphoribosyltransferase
MKSSLLMDAIAIDRALSRMAHEIVERNLGSETVALIGIRSHGVPLAQRLAGKMGEILRLTIPTGELDIGMHRDDFAMRSDGVPSIRPSDIPFDVTDKTIVLVDDVLFTGRTTRAALDALTDLGRPQRIQLAALIDRGHRELPIRADFVGKNVPTAIQERVQVFLSEVDGKDEVLLES